MQLGIVKYQVNHLSIKDNVVIIQDFQNPALFHHIMVNAKAKLIH